jgi:P22 coat protein - gene protein 5
MAGNFEAVRKEVTAEILRILSNNTVCPRLIKRDFNKYWEENGRRIGSSLDIRRPLRVIGADGQALQPEGLVRVTVPMTISYWNQESFIYNDTEEAMFLDEDKRKAYLRPHVVNLANKVDRLMLQYMQSITPNFVGTPGTVPTSLDTYNSAQTKLNQLLAMGANRSVIYNSAYNQQIIKAGQTLFNPQQIIGKQYLEGKVGRYAEFDFFIDEQVPSGTVGTYAGAGVVNGANQAGTSLITNGWTSSSLSLSQGSYSDRITIAGVYEINSQSRLTLPGVLKQFAVVAPVTDTAGAATLTLFPALIPSGPYQNCSGSPSSGAAITIAGATGATCQTAFAVQEEAFTWASIPLMNTEEFGSKCDTITDPETGISIRIIWQWDNRLGEVTVRMDFVWGIAQTYADYAAAVVYG